MALNPAVPFYSEGSVHTCQAGGAITGKTFVKISGNPVSERTVVVTAGSGDKVYGVAGFDAATGDGVTVYRLPNVMPVTAGAALTAGTEVQSDAAGKAIPLAAGKSAGVVHADAANAAEAKIGLC